MILELDDLTHRYGNEPAAERVSFGIESGQLVALLGPSGCGKTTLVQAIAGHVRPTRGRILLRDVDVTYVPPEKRQVGVVFQRSTLFPHMTVGENVAYGLKTRDVETDRRDDLVSEYLELVALRDQRGTYPAELSGGQRRRVELARALAPRPDVLLLDEPLSALDRRLRTRLREVVSRIQRETGVTTLYVTHNQDEAMALADRIVVMNDGEIAGVGRPRTLYESPPNPFVASFLGRTNALSATVVEQRPLTVALGEATLTLENTDTDIPAGSAVTCHIRPENVSFGDRCESGTALSVPGEVKQVADVGRHYDVTVWLKTGDELVVARRVDPPRPGDSIPIKLPVHNVSVFTKNGTRVEGLDDGVRESG